MEEEEFGRPLNDASRVRSRDRAWISMPDRYCDALPSQSHRRHLLPLALRVRPHGEALRHVTGTCSLVLQNQSYIDGHINQEHLLLQNYRQIRPCVLQSSSSRHGGRVEVRGRVSQPFIAFYSSTARSPHPPRSLIPAVPPSLPLPLAFRPPSSLYISRISTLDGLDVVSASCRHFSSRISRGVCVPERGVMYPERGD